MLTRRTFITLAGAAGALAIAGGGAYLALPEDEKFTGEPKIAYGEEPCTRCGMVISDDRFAAAWRESASRELHFDDVGCMLVYAREHPPSPGTSYYVCNYSGAGWLDAPSAAYVVAPGIKSPMSYDIAAFASSAAAESMARVPTYTTGTWAGLLQTVEARG